MTPLTSATTFVTPSGRGDAGGDAHAQASIEVTASTVSDFVPGLQISGNEATGLPTS